MKRLASRHIPRFDAPYHLPLRLSDLRWIAKSTHVRPKKLLRNREIRTSSEIFTAMQQKTQDLTGRRRVLQQHFTMLPYGMAERVSFVCPPGIRMNTRSAHVEKPPYPYPVPQKSTLFNRHGAFTSFSFYAEFLGYAKLRKVKISSGKILRDRCKNCHCQYKTRSLTRR